MKSRRHILIGLASIYVGIPFLVPAFAGTWRDDFSEKKKGSWQLWGDESV